MTTPLTIAPPPPTVISRKAALKQNLPKYFTGKPCKNGHITERLTATYTCCECHKKHNQTYRTNNHELIDHRSRLWKENNKERCAMMRKQQYQKMKTQNPLKYAQMLANRKSYYETKQTIAEQ